MTECGATHKRSIEAIKNNLNKIKEYMAIFIQDQKAKDNGVFIISIYQGPPRWNSQIQRQRSVVLDLQSQPILQQLHNTLVHQRILISSLHMGEESLVQFQKVEESSIFTNWAEFKNTQQYRIWSKIHDAIMKAPMVVDYMTQSSCPTHSRIKYSRANKPNAKGPRTIKDVRANNSNNSRVKQVLEDAEIIEQQKIQESKTSLEFS